MAATKKPTKRKRRRLKKGRVALAVLLLVAIVAGVVLSLTVFFPVKTIKVKEDTRYTIAEIIQNSGIAKGDNLFRTRESDVARKIGEALPYVAEVKLDRALPDTILLTVTEQKPEYAFVVKEGYLIVGGGKALEVVAERPAELTLVEYTPKYKIGHALSMGENEDVFTRLTKAIAAAKLDKITVIAFADASKITLTYDDRVTLELGSIEDVDKKLKKAVQILAAVDADYNGHAVGTVRLQYEDSYFERGTASSEAASQESKEEPKNSQES